ncbi:MAG: type II toxin-antitoxin system VapC family toxin [Pirellulales bacterium]|nr:type II toxin-antitoxin system VapC family toxin [Pirellulales bacterium]
MGSMNMLIPKIYIETSIPSFYCTTRTDPESVACKGWTQHWWDFKREGCKVFTSEVVIEELENGDYPTKQEALSLIDGIPILTVEPAVLEITKTYTRHFLMPDKPMGDAMHLALASFHQCDFLLTWNCQHLANANKFQHIRRVNSMLGLFIPSLVTPLELLGENP